MLAFYLLTSQFPSGFAASGYSAPPESPTAATQPSQSPAQYTWYFHVLRVVLYHRGQIATPPQRITRATPPRPLIKPRMQAVVQRYLAVRRLTDEPCTVLGFDTTTYKFITWITHAYPQVETWAQVTREQVLEYAEAMKTVISPQTKKPLGVVSRRGQLSRSLPIPRLFLAVASLLATVLTLASCAILSHLLGFHRFFSCLQFIRLY